LPFLREWEIEDSTIIEEARDESASYKKDILMKFWIEKLSYEKDKGENERWEEKNNQKL
jgi:hypothetical protein